MCDKKENRMSVLYPELLKEWDYEKNIEFNINLIACCSGKKVWWKCIKGHEWKAPLYSRTYGKSTCPYCSGHKVSEKNKLSRFEVAQEWNYEKNKDLIPDNFSFGSHKEVWWKCKNGHEWMAEIKARCRENKCPYCSNRKIDKNNSLSKLNPNVAKEWDYSKNVGVTPDDVPTSSKKIFWWKCSSGHEWSADLDHRNRGQGCPFCNKINLLDGSSFRSMPEAYLYLKFKARNILMEIDKCYDGFGQMRFDFYLPKFNTYIEITSFYDGAPGYAGKIWNSYFEKILKKKEYVEKTLCQKFRFIQIKMNRQQLMYVKKFIK